MRTARIWYLVAVAVVFLLALAGMVSDIGETLPETVVGWGTPINFIFLCAMFLIAGWDLRVLMSEGRKQ